MSLSDEFLGGLDFGECCLRSSRWVRASAGAGRGSGGELNEGADLSPFAE